MKEKLGIENLKIAIVAAIRLGEKIEKNYVDDGEISLSEALGIGASSFGDVLKVIKLGSEIKNEFNDLDNEEKLQLANLVKEELDLQNDKVENIIEKALDFLLGLNDLIESIK